MCCVSKKIEEPIYPGATVTQGQGHLAAMLFILHHQLPAAVKASLMALLNFLIPNLVNESKYISRNVHAVSRAFYCEVCQNYLGQDPTQCSHCNTLFDKADSLQKGNFFLFTSLKELLKDILQRYSSVLLPKRVNHDCEIQDVMDGMMYQKLLEEGTLAADDLTLTWNCDGAQISKHRYSVWPLQFTINELPFIHRKDNVLVAGLWFGDKSPKMNTFLKPFIDECCDLAQNPFQWSDSSGTVHSSKVFCLIGSSDAVARPLLRNCKKFNGECGCDWCLHPGMNVKKGGGSMRSYPYDETVQVARSKEMFEDDAEQAELSKSPVNGVKGKSLLSSLPVFDIVFGFVPEYMHSVLLGVSKQLMLLWMDPDNSSKEWYLGEKIKHMDSRLQRLKLPSEISQPPRPLKNRVFWEASEWRAFVLFYAVAVLPGMLNSPFLAHYLELSFSIHILLQESISHHDIEKASQFLRRFVMNMKDLYGEENVSFNCHQLIHLAESVRNWGPLWATSAFTFERNNGNLRVLLKGSHSDPQQIFQRFLSWHHIPSHLQSLVFNRDLKCGELLAKLSPLNGGYEPYTPLGKSHQLDITGSTKKAVEKLLNQPVLVKSAEGFDSFAVGNTVYRSTSCEASERYDCVVKLKDGSAGEIQVMLPFQNCVCTSSCSCQVVPIIVVHLYKVKCDRSISSDRAEDLQRIFTKVEPTRDAQAFYIDDIKCKCMYVDSWLVPLPNSNETY